MCFDMWVFFKESFPSPVPSYGVLGVAIAAKGDHVMRGIIAARAAGFDVMSLYPVP